jgi:tetratricopeptide (TPR) repeat protein
MKISKYLFALFLIALFACASTKDPGLKLQRASEGFNKLDDPVKAEKLIFDAMEDYSKEKNQLGLAEAYRQYALFLRSNAVEKFEEYFTEEGFEDETVTFKTRYEKAVEYFNKSKDLYQDYGHLDILSSIYISLAKTYTIMGKQQESCDAFSKGLTYYGEYKKANPEAKELRSEEMATYEEYIGILKKQAGCE